MANEDSNEDAPGLGGCAQVGWFAAFLPALPMGCTCVGPSGLWARGLAQGLGTGLGTGTGTGTGYRHWAQGFGTGLAQDVPRAG